MKRNIAMRSEYLISVDFNYDDDDDDDDRFVLSITLCRILTPELP